jgi:hypothetical protein
MVLTHKDIFPFACISISGGTLDVILSILGEEVYYLYNVTYNWNSRGHKNI